jgi:hypothetical protein
MPSSRDLGAAWPPVGLEPPAVALVPLPADVVVPPAKHAPPPAAPVAPVAPESVTPPPAPAGISPADVDPEADSVSPAGHRGTLARTVKIVDKVKAPVKAKPNPPEQAAPVRHETPDIPLWSRGRPGTPDWPSMWAGRRPAGFSFGEHHQGCGGGGRHRR